MEVRLRLTRSRVAILVVLAALLGAGVGYAAIPHSTTGVISGCYEKNTGLLRVINAQDGKSCTRFEAPLTWSQQGPQGVPGLRGLQGEQGLQGIDGVKGQDGAAAPAQHIEVETVYTNHGYGALGGGLTVDVGCDPGWVMTGGGADANDGTLIRSSPALTSSLPNVWVARADGATFGSSTNSLDVWVVCMRLVP
jgi:hypothetical protein